MTSVQKEKKVKQVFHPYESTQDFYKLRNALLAEGKLFEDPEFPPQDSSISFTGNKLPKVPYEWKRPSEIVKKPEFIVNGQSRFDVKQGQLGDCWLIAAIANLTLNKERFQQVVPLDQEFNKNYAGIFHFRFWWFGRWVDVVIDDRLVTTDGSLFYLHSSEDNEFWSALLEKAYAKLHGSYVTLRGGFTLEGMVDFTGGVAERFDLTQKNLPNLHMIMLKAHERCSLMGCSIDGDPKVVEAVTKDGLVKGHAFSVTRVEYVKVKSPKTTGKILLIRVRNPWGTSTEWNGAWSDSSPEWKYVQQDEKTKIDFLKKVDGEFWMTYKEFTDHFSCLEICNLTPDSLTEDELVAGKRSWELATFEGKWVQGVSAGGCNDSLECFATNPQYRVELKDTDENDDKCTIIVALTQKHRRAMQRVGKENLTIGYSIYSLTDPKLPVPLNFEFFQSTSVLPNMPSYSDTKEVTCRFKLLPGSYCIVPTTYEAGHDGEFLLRVFSEKKHVIQ